MKFLKRWFAWLPWIRKPASGPDLRMSDQLEREIEKKLIDNERYYD